MRRRDPAQVRSALARWLPARLEADSVTITGLRTPDSGGLSNETFLVDVEVAGQPQRLVVQAGPAGPGLFAVYDIPLMFRLQADLRAHSAVPVATVRFLETDPSVLGASFYVMDNVAGQVPDETPSYHQQGWLADSTPGQRADLWWSALSALGALHRLDVRGAGFEYLVETQWGMALDADPATRRIEQWLDFLEWASPGPPPERLLRVWDALSDSRPPPPPSLSVTWGDAKLTNLIVERSRVAAVLDWELAGIGAAEEDLGHFLMIDWLLSLSVGAVRLDGLPSQAETVVAYEGVLGRRLVDVDWWFDFALARVASHSHRMMVRQQQLGRLPPDADLAQANSILPLLVARLGL